MAFLEPVMQQNFLEYASYVVVDRAIPDIRDGCKPVQRRILHTMFRLDDGKFNKVANIIGDTMKLHPHGDASIGAALVVLANKRYFIERQGNYGSVITGHQAAAARYIEARLTKLAKATLFNPELTETIPSYDGRRDEPVALPAKVPVSLMLGAEGIAVGMATKILPHNFVELLQAEIAILNGEDIEVYPDFEQGGLIDVSEYDRGRGKVKVRARLEALSEKKIVIREVPFGTSTESLIASIEAAAQKGKVKISSIDDFTTEDVEIELTLTRGTYAEEVIPQLFAYTDCEVSISTNLLVICDGHPRVCTVNEVLAEHVASLRGIIKRELELELGKLEDKRHWLTLEQIFIENRVYKRLEGAATENALSQEVYDGMAPFADSFVRPLTDEDVKRLLELKIRRISAFDKKKNRGDIAAIVRAEKHARGKLRALTKTTIAAIEGFIEDFGEPFARRTEIVSFEEVSKREVARQDIKLNYDKETGFFGTAVRQKDIQLCVSEYDFVLVICRDGSYRIMPPVEKVLLSAPVLHCDVFDPEKGAFFTVAYRDKEKYAFAKKIHIHKFIRNRVYNLIKGDGGRIDLLLDVAEQRGVELKYVPIKRQRVGHGSFDLSALRLMSPSAKGLKMSPKRVSKMKLLR